MVARDAIIGPSLDIGFDWTFGRLDFGIWTNESLPWNQCHHQHGHAKLNCELVSSESILGANLPQEWR